LPDKSITQVNSKAVMPNPIANQESMHNKQRTTTNLLPSQVGQRQGLIATGSYKGDQCMLAFPLHSLHM
jgi:hypothetical protein